MQTSNRLFDDIAKVASGAASTFVGLKQELDAMVRQRVERLVADFDLVRRDEFEAMSAMAANARAELEQLERRVADLEAKVASGQASPGGAGSGEATWGETAAGETAPGEAPAGESSAAGSQPGAGSA